MKKDEVWYGGDDEKVAVDRVNWSKVTDVIERRLGEDAPVKNLVALSRAFEDLCQRGAESLSQL